MRIGVVIERNNYYRLLAPVVDAALAMGWEVVCWHDYAQPRHGTKGYEFPAVEAAPRFRHGTPVVRTYGGREKLPDALARTGIDAVVSIVLPSDPFVAERGAPASRWIGLQYAAELSNCLMPPGIFAASLVGLYSEWWLEFGLRYLRELGATVADDDTEREIRRKSVVVGFPELDQFRDIDPAEERRRWQIPSGKPVVAFLPYPFHSNLKTPWSRWVFASGPRLWRRLRLRLAGERCLESQLLRGWDDLALTRAVRRFCDANDAYLLVKARAKDPVPPYLRRVADRVVYDDGHYPATILRVLGVADLCVHFYSATALEAAGCGVPGLSICPELPDMGISLAWQPWVFSREEGSAFQFRGVAETMAIGHAIETLPRKRLADFALDHDAREAYAAKFLGFGDGHSSMRLLDAVRAVVEGRTAFGVPSPGHIGTLGA